MSEPVWINDELAAAQAVIELAAGTIDEDGFSKFLRANVE
jgi:hypothetical protein